jgi:hypothetical protein
MTCLVILLKNLNNLPATQLKEKVEKIPIIEIESIHEQEITESAYEDYNGTTRQES